MDIYSEQNWFKNKKILVADDNQTFLMYMGILLKRLGFTIIVAESGLEVLKLLKLIEPDIVMLDIRMGTMDGIEVLKSIKEDKQTSHIPVIMASVDANREMIEKCRELGCAAYLSKPIKLDKLYEALEKNLFLLTDKKREHLRASVNKKVIVIHNGIEYKLYSETFSEGGIYLRKKEPLPVGSEVEIILPLESGCPLQLKGVVVHTKRLFGDVFNLPPGMGISFKDITDEQAKILKHCIEKIITGDILDSQEEQVIGISEDEEEAS
ncbi:MAG: response regulator [Nitrospirota bacterium]